MNSPEFKLKNEIATITLRAENRKNAIDRKDLELIVNFLKKIENEKLKCLVLTGKGDVFSSGIYIEELKKGDWSKNPVSEVCDLIENLPFISICFLNGSIYGGSVELALSCDFRIGFNGVKIKIPATNFGIHYGVKGIKRCLEIFGLQLSRKILFLGHSLSFDDLVKVGFLDYYGEDLKASKAILNKIIKEISLLSLDTLRDIKASINDLRSNNVDDDKEKIRFSRGFENGTVAARLKNYKKLR